MNLYSEMNGLSPSRSRPIHYEIRRMGEQSLRQRSAGFRDIRSSTGWRRRNSIGARRLVRRRRILVRIRLRQDDRFGEFSRDIAAEQVAAARARLSVVRL